ncbi:pyruvate kinase [Zopfochytrium polystomum]|nr:pyruvate kinase [Zopfochytrium polystomum]
MQSSNTVFHSYEARGPAPTNRLPRQSPAHTPAYFSLCDECTSASAFIGLLWPSRIQPRPPQSLQDRRTKIVATLGPASVPRIREMIEAGCNVFRLNFSHISDPESQTSVIESIRREAAAVGLPVAILGDLCGPKIRCNVFSNGLPGISLVTGETVRIVCSSEPGSPGIIATPIPQIVGALELGHRVLLDDGSIVLKVKERVSADELVCEILVGGFLKPKKGINVPDIAVGLPALTEKDKADARYMFKMRLDYVALSFVQKAQDVQDLLDLFAEFAKEDPELAKDDSLEEDWRPHIISKIEKPQALDVIDSIMQLTDGIMVARGDLGVECSLEQVPLIQKTLIRKANAVEKPVITATQMLESMIESPSPTRAEVSDVANSVLDGTDAVMLSAESAAGKFPIEAVTAMASICRNAEAGARILHNRNLAASIRPNKDFGFVGHRKVSEFAHCIADAAVAAAEEGEAKAMIVFTTSSEMAIFVSKRRPSMSIIAVTPSSSIYRRLSLLFGVHPVLSASLLFKSSTGGVSKLKKGSTTSLSAASSSASLEIEGPHPQLRLRNTDAILATTESDIMNSPSAKLTELNEGDSVVFCAGFHHPFPGLSNTIKMGKFGDSLHSQNAHRRWSDVIAAVRRGDTVAPGIDADA